MERNGPCVLEPNTLYEIRLWERINLPHYGKDVGYLLFLELARHGGISQDTLKAFYLSMPYAESTIRLVLRNLEVDGWIETTRLPSDKRSRQIELTNKFRDKQGEWLRAVAEIINKERGN